MTPTEIARGYLAGSEGTLPPARDTSLDPRTALEQVILKSLQRQPCGVAFSGGRDSALVLAIATFVARREGLPDPIPITRVFPALAETDETSWQEMIIDHLSLSDWQRLEFTDELDVIGPYAQRHLLTHGVIWPAAIATSVPLFEAVAGGTLLDGEGGDEILGIDVHRIAPLADLIRHPRPLSRRRLRAAAASFAPARMRYPRALRDRAAAAGAWLQPDAHASFAADLANDRVHRPLSFAASVRAFPLKRIVVAGQRNRSSLARSYDVQLSSPLFESEFVHAVARAGGPLGSGTRTDVLRILADTLLPPPLAARTGKAVFNRAYLGHTSREFARSWSGLGIDTNLVDAEGLRATWLEESAHWMSALLIQQAWLMTAPRGQTTSNLA